MLHQYLLHKLYTKIILTVFLYLLDVHITTLCKEALGLVSSSLQ